jgi:murein DD-endopeptidase MepM/ murein hydrolase activator NlpD
MQVILITKSGRNLLSLRLMGWRLWLSVGLLALLLLAVLRVGAEFTTSEGSMADRLTNLWAVSRDDAVAREIGGLKAKIEHLESTLSALEGEEGKSEGTAADGVPIPTTPPRLEELEMRAKKISMLVDEIAAARKQQLEHVASGLAARPIDAPISSGFGTRIDPFNGTRAFHRGIDFNAPAGTPIYSVGDGIVEFIGKAPKYGNMIDIRHSDRLVSRYSHLEGIEVTTGMPLRAGQRIARVGATGRATGAHLHFEFILDRHPVNPSAFINNLYKAPLLTNNKPLDNNPLRLASQVSENAQP